MAFSYLVFFDSPPYACYIYLASHFPFLDSSTVSNSFDTVSYMYYYPPLLCALKSASLSHGPHSSFLPSTFTYVEMTVI